MQKQQAASGKRRPIALDIVDSLDAMRHEKAPMRHDDPSSSANKNRKPF
jgi:hypothetical protein